ncbi:MAG TPA: hypothetical protein VGO67_04020 [Verrucomicrobiae bacterium]|jgi:hypothetical protein
MMMKIAWLSFIAGVVLGVASALSFKWFDRPAIQRPPTELEGNFEIHSLPSDAPYWAIKIDRKTGKTWGMSQEGAWLNLRDVNIESAGDWLKKHGTETNKMISN